MLDAELRLRDAALVEERLHLRGGRVRRRGCDRVQHALRRRVAGFASREALIGGSA